MRGAERPEVLVEEKVADKFLNNKLEAGQLSPVLLQLHLSACVVMVVTRYKL